MPPDMLVLATHLSLNAPKSTPQPSSSSSIAFIKFTLNSRAVSSFRRASSCSSSSILTRLSSVSSRLLLHCRLKSLPFAFLIIEVHFSGTFLGDNEGDKKRLGVTERTTSLWSYVNRPDILHQFINPMYEPNQRVIWPSVAPMSLVS